jgi:hypothetical protein
MDVLLPKKIVPEGVVFVGPSMREILVETSVPKVVEPAYRGTKVVAKIPSVSLRVLIPQIEIPVFL